MSRDAGGSQNSYNAARSNHPGWVSALLVDGSTRFFKNKINVRVWQALGSTRGGEILSSDSY